MKVILYSTQSAKKEIVLLTRYPRDPWTKVDGQWILITNFDK